jgi:hypothetical protein
VVSTDAVDLVELSQDVLLMKSAGHPRSSLTTLVETVTRTT